MDTGTDTTERESPMTESAPHIERIALPLYGAKGWLKFLGILFIVYGVMTALSIVGLLIAWLPIWMGVLLYQTAGALEAAVHAGDEEALMRAMGKLRTYFVIMGVLTLIGLVVTVLMMGLGFGMGMGMGHLPTTGGGRVM